MTTDDLPAHAKTALLEEHRTDAGNARRLAACYAGRIRYHEQEKQWLFWDEQRWRVGSYLKVMSLAKKTIRRFIRAAVEMPGDPEERKRAMRFAMASESRRSLENMEALSRDLLAIDTHQLDADPWLLNVLNGTLDLRTGQLRKHDRADFITKLAPGHYEPAATCPKWDAFLAIVTDGDSTLADYLRRFVGYTLTGSTGEQVVHFWNGSGENGKSTLDKVLRLLLGDYAASAAMATFTDTTADLTPRPDLMRLRGLRYVSAGEPKRRVALNESMLKLMSGGDEIVTRELYGKVTAYTPQYKLALLVNDRPTVESNDHAIRRRLREVPFAVKISDKVEKVEDWASVVFQAEAPGILNWAVAGCQEWQAHKLGAVPKAIQEATAAYWGEIDTPGRFVTEECIADPKHSETTGALYLAYAEWAEARGFRPVAKVEFGRRLAAQGFKDYRVHIEGRRCRAWGGLRLKSGTDGQIDTSFPKTPDKEAVL